MPLEEKSHAQRPNPRGRVTDTHGPYPVGEFRVLRVGGTVALHLATPGGRFVFHLSERSFALHARSPRDDQGNEFRSIQEIDAERVRIADETGATPARDLTDAPEIEVEMPRRFRLSEETKALYLAAYVEKVTTRASWSTIANKYRFSQTSFESWCYAHRALCAEELRQSHPPVLKPSGQLL